MKVRFFLNTEAEDPVYVRNVASAALPRPGDLVDLPGETAARRVMAVRHNYESKPEVRVLLTKAFVEETEKSLTPAVGLVSSAL